MARPAFDITLQDNEDFIFENGDFRVGESDEQHIRHLHKADIGQYRVSPDVGIGYYRRLNGPFYAARYENIIRKQLEIDGYLVVRVTVDSDGSSNVNAERIK